MSPTTPLHGPTLAPTLGFRVTLGISIPHAHLDLNDHHETRLESTLGALKPIGICRFQSQSKQMARWGLQVSTQKPMVGGAGSGPHVATVGSKSCLPIPPEQSWAPFKTHPVLHLSS